MTQSAAFTRLRDFLLNKMSMSHVYQPVIIKDLLSNGGQSDVRDMATTLLNLDISQVDYFVSIINKTPKEVLSRHGIVSKQPRNPNYYLEGYSDLSEDEVEQLINICEKKLEGYQEKRGSDIWSYRDRSRRPIKGSVRYEVLKRANFRCELCGVEASNRAIEVDHIVPKSLGGKDDLGNYQALCYKCNTGKNNRDDTNFAKVKLDYQYRKPDCLFCNITNDRELVAENTLAMAFRDAFGVTEGHSLVVPKRHVESYFELSTAERSAIDELLFELKVELEKSDQSITGYNVGTNSGVSAGQTVFHCHVHLIPRRNGDSENPRGGVRKVIPEKAGY
jgi:ATP adenylyltransferase